MLIGYEFQSNGRDGYERGTWGWVVRTMNRKGEEMMSSDGGWPSRESARKARKMAQARMEGAVR